MYNQNSGSKTSPLLPGAELSTIPQAVTPQHIHNEIEYHGHPELMSFEELADIDDL